MFLPGDNSKKFSFLIGFGNNYPQKPHHRSSSCPSTGSCGWNDYNSGNPNPQVSWILIILPKSGLNFILNPVLIHTISGLFGNLMIFWVYCIIPQSINKNPNFWLIEQWLRFLVSLLTYKTCLNRKLLYNSWNYTNKTCGLSKKMFCRYWKGL